MFFKATEEKHFSHLNQCLVVLVSPKWLDYTLSKLDKLCRPEWRYEIKCELSLCV